MQIQFTGTCHSKRAFIQHAHSFETSKTIRETRSLATVYKMWQLWYYSYLSCTWAPSGSLVACNVLSNWQSDRPRPHETSLLALRRLLALHFLWLANRRLGRTHNWLKKHTHTSHPTNSKQVKHWTKHVKASDECAIIGLVELKTSLYHARFEVFTAFQLHIQVFYRLTN